MIPGMFAGGVMEEELPGGVEEVAALVEEVQPKETQITLTDEQYDKLERDIFLAIDTDKTAKSGLQERWTQTRLCYMMDPAQSSKAASKEFPIYPHPLLRMLMDRIVGGLQNALTQISPQVQIVPYGENQFDAGEQENVLEFQAEQSRWAQALAYSLLNAGLYNLGAMRLRALKKDGQFTGTRWDWFEPDDVCIYPNYVQSVADARTCGTKYFLTKFDIQRKIDEGEFRDISVIGGMADPLKENLRKSLLTETASVSPEDDVVEMWTIYHKMKIKGKYVVVECDYAYESRTCLRVQMPVLEDTAPLVAFQMIQHEKQMYSEDSVANSGKQLTLLSTDLQTATVLGTFATAQPTVIISGSTELFKDSPLKPGTIRNVRGSNVKVDVVSLPFDVQKMVYLQEYNQRMAEGVMGVPAISAGQSLPGGATATEVNALEQAGAGREASYMVAISDAGEECFRLMRRFTYELYDQNVQVFGPQSVTKDREALNKPCIMKMSAQSGSMNANQIFTKTQVLLGMSDNPMSIFDHQETELEVARQLRLPMDIQSLVKTPVTEVSEAATALLAQGVDPRNVLKVGMAVMMAAKENGVGQDTQTGGVPQTAEAGGVSGGQPGIGGGSSSTPGADIGL